MKHDFSDFLTDLPIGSETLAVLRERNIHTVGDLECAFQERSLKSLLDADQHIEVIKAAWTWIMRPYQNPA